jgi:hypothetical protein
MNYQMYLNCIKFEYIYNIFKIFKIFFYNAIVKIVKISHCQVIPPLDLNPLCCSILY